MSETHDSSSSRFLKNDVSYNTISKNLVTLENKHVKKNNKMLKRIIDDNLIPSMKKNDKYFKIMFNTIMYGGSYYKRLKINKPDEYDLNLIIKLPIKYKFLEIKTDNCNPGYIKIKIDVNKINCVEPNNWRSHFLDGCYVDQNKVRNWMQSVLVKSLNDLSHTIAGYTVNYAQSEPAFTLSIIRSMNKSTTSNKRNDNFIMNIDLVPCLSFENVTLDGFRKSNALIVIAKPLRLNTIIKPNLQWRACFYKDEKHILKGQIKSNIRMMKKLRDVQQWDNLKSYYIETLYLNVWHNKNFDLEHVGKSSTQQFFYMLHKLHKALENKAIYSYWHSKHNLLEKINVDHLQDLDNCLLRIINHISNTENLYEVFHYQNNDI